LNQIGIDKQTFYNDLQEYRYLLKKLKRESIQDSYKNEIVNDTEISVSQANYSLMLWSVAAVVALILLFYFWRKQ
jgi:hypothetical protein